MEIEDKGKLTKYEPVPIGKMYIAVVSQSMSHGTYHYCAYNKDKAELIKGLQNASNIKLVKIYNVDLED